MVKNQRCRLIESLGREVKPPPAQTKKTNIVVATIFNKTLTTAKQQFGN